MADAIRVGLIGVGKHGRRYAQHIREDLPDVDIVALAGRDPAKARAAAAEFRCRAYGDYRELVFASEVDAVIAAVPPLLHREVVLAAVEARRPLLLEKPAAVSVAVGRGMLAASVAAGVPIMVAQTLRYNAVVRTMRDQIAAVGPIHSVCLAQRFEPSSLPWIDDPKLSGGGMLLLTGVHMFDLLRVLTGLEAASASCEMNSVVTRRTEDNFSVVIRMHGGSVIACVTGSRATQSRCGAIELTGERGQLVGDHVLGTLHRVEGTAVTALPLPAPVMTVREVVADFADSLRAGRAMPIPLEEGLRAVAIAEACYRSSRERRTADVEEI